jgi:hypothetical protein
MVLPAFPASSIIPKRIDDVTHSDEQRLDELLPHCELSQPPYGQDDPDDAFETSQNDTNVALSASSTPPFACHPSRVWEEAGMIHGVMSRKC